MIDFQKVEANVRALKKQAAAGQIDTPTLEKRLKEMIDCGPDGYYWMFGHLTEQWYRHDGWRWVLDDPDKLAAAQAGDGHQSYHWPEDEPLFTLPDTMEIWRSTDTSWFFIALATLGLVFGVVYASSL